jgi:hypothetical protein
MTTSESEELIKFVKLSLPALAFAPRDCTCEICNRAREKLATAIVESLKTRYRLARVEP